MLKADVSVVITCYGDFDRERAQLAIQSAATQVGASVEIVVVESTSSPRLDNANTELHMSYIFVPTSSGHGAYSPGRLRNVGIIHAAGEFVYLTDADIIFQDESYLARILTEVHHQNADALRWPPMRRLPEEFVDTFAASVRHCGLAGALQSLERQTAYLALPPGEPYDLTIMKRALMTEVGQTFTTRPEDHVRYQTDEKLRGLEPLIWHQTVHIGGILARRAHVLDVGAYCESFERWGNEDIDLQWKLGQVYELKRTRLIAEHEVLHLDHPKPYFDRAQWLQNEALYDQRKSEGTDLAIRADRRSLNLLTSEFAECQR